VVAGLRAFFIPLGGPQAHDLSGRKTISKTGHQHRDLSTTLRFGRDDKGEGGAPIESSYRTGLFITLRSVEKHFHERSAEQISPLRYAPVEMTNLWCD
jgi:hypothetical protein